MTYDSENRSKHELTRLKAQVESALGRSFEWREVEAGVNDIYILNSDHRDLVVKVQTDSGNEIKESIRIEPEIYRIVLEETSIPSPEIIYENFPVDSSENSFYVMEKMDGVNPVEKWPEMSQERRETLVLEYGKMLGEVHNLRSFEKSGRLDAENSYIDVVEGCEWRERLRQKIYNWRSKLKNFEELPDVPFSEELFQRVREAEPVLIHEDNRLDNLLVEESEITAFLDWSGPETGSRKYDLARAEYYIIDGDATFPGRDILTEKQKNSLRHKLLTGYRKTSEIGLNWLQSDKRKIYRYAAVIDIASGFPEWGKHFDKKIYQKTRKELSKRIKTEQPKELLN